MGCRATKAVEKPEVEVQTIAVEHVSASTNTQLVQREVASTETTPPVVATASTSTFIPVATAETSTYIEVTTASTLTWIPTKSVITCTTTSSCAIPLYPDIPMPEEGLAVLLGSDELHRVYGRRRTAPAIFNGAAASYQALLDTASDIRRPPVVPVGVGLLQLWGLAHIDLCSALSSSTYDERRVEAAARSTFLTHSGPVVIPVWAFEAQEKRNAGQLALQGPRSAGRGSSPYRPKVPPLQGFSPSGTPQRGRPHSPQRFEMSTPRLAGAEDESARVKLADEASEDLCGLDSLLGGETYDARRVQPAGGSKKFADSAQVIPVSGQPMTNLHQSVKDWRTQAGGSASSRGGGINVGAALPRSFEQNRRCGATAAHYATMRGRAEQGADLACGGIVPVSGQPLDNVARAARHGGIIDMSKNLGRMFEQRRATISIPKMEAETSAMLSAGKERPLVPVIAAKQLLAGDSNAECAWPAEFEARRVKMDVVGEIAKGSETCKGERERPVILIAKGIVDEAVSDASTSVPSDSSWSVTWPSEYESRRSSQERANTQAMMAMASAKEREVSVVPVSGDAFDEIIRQRKHDCFPPCKEYERRRLDLRAELERSRPVDKSEMELNTVAPVAGLAFENLLDLKGRQLDMRKLWPVQSERRRYVSLPSDADRLRPEEAERSHRPTVPAMADVLMDLPEDADFSKAWPASVVLQRDAVAALAATAKAKMQTENHTTPSHPVLPVAGDALQAFAQAWEEAERSPTSNKVSYPQLASYEARRIAMAAVTAQAAASRIRLEEQDRISPVLPAAGEALLLPVKGPRWPVSFDQRRQQLQASLAQAQWRKRADEEIDFSRGMVAPVTADALDRISPLLAPLQFNPPPRKPPAERRGSRQSHQVATQQRGTPQLDLGPLRSHGYEHRRLALLTVTADAAAAFASLAAGEALRSAQSSGICMLGNLAGSPCLSAPPCRVVESSQSQDMLHYEQRRVLLASVVEQARAEMEADEMNDVLSSRFFY